MADDSKSPESPYGAALEITKLILKALGPSAPILITIISIWVAYSYGNSINQQARIQAENSLTEKQNQLNEAYSSFSDQISNIGSKQLETINKLVSTQETLGERQAELNELERMNRQAIDEAKQNQAELVRLRSENRDLTQKVNDLTQKNQAATLSLEQLNTENADIRQAMSIIASDPSINYLAENSALAIQKFTAPDAQGAAGIIQQAINTPNDATIENLQRLRGISTADLQSVLDSIENSASIISGQQGLGNPTAWVITGAVDEHEMDNVTVIWSAGGRVTEVMYTEQLLYAQYLNRYDWFTQQYGLFSADSEFGGFREYYLSYYSQNGELPGSEIFRVLVSDRDGGNWNFQDVKSSTTINEIELHPLPMPEWPEDLVADFIAQDYNTPPTYELYQRSRIYTASLDRKNAEVPENVYKYLEQLLTYAGRREEDSLQNSLGIYADIYTWGSLGPRLVTGEIDLENISYSKSGEAPDVSYQMTMISRNVEYNERTRWQIDVYDDGSGTLAAELYSEYLPVSQRL